MQVFVRRADFTGQPDEVVYVQATYDDTTTVDPTSYDGNLITILSLPPGAVLITRATPPAEGDPPPLPADTRPKLSTTWRTDYATNVLTGEANRRITAAFPDYSQRNSNAELNGYITTYGADATVWPAYQISRKAEIDRCWNYVNSVRASANAMGSQSLPLDPTANGNWPTVISPYVPS